MFTIETIKEIRSFVNERTKPFANGRILVDEVYQLYSGDLPKADFASLVAILANIETGDWSHAHKDYRPCFHGIGIRK